MHERTSRSADVEYHRIIVSDTSDRPPNRPAPAPRPSLPPPRASLSLNRATLPPPGAAPDFLMPRPSVTPASTGERAPASPEDPWRERIAALEVQLSAARSMLTRALEELSPLREKVDGLAAQISSSDDSMRTTLTLLTERTVELEHLARAGRAAIATMHHDLAEQRRVHDARAARLSSIEERVLAIEHDPRLPELRLLVDRLEMRLLAKERENESIRAHFEAQMASLRAESHPKEAPSLRSISGIGPKLEAKLIASGVADIRALAELSEDGRGKLAKDLGIAKSKLDAWCELARRQS